MSLLLALDTATKYAGIALYDDDGVLGELNWRSSRRQTVELAPAVAELCRMHDVAPAQIEAVGVAIGPGSYTGCRIALSFVKGLVAGRPLAVIGVPTLDCLAYAAPPTSTPVCAVVAAGRQRFCWALYQDGGPQAQRQSDWGLASLADILPSLTHPTWFIGELDRAAQAFLAAQADKVAGISTPALATRRAAILAEIAYKRWQAGATDDPATLAPIYLG